MTTPIDDPVAFARYCRQVNAMIEAGARWAKARFDAGQSVQLRLPNVPKEVVVIASLDSVLEVGAIDDDVTVDFIRTVNAAADGEGTLLMLQAAIEIMISQGMLR